MSSTMEPFLPVELEQEIFQTSALLYPDCIPRLLLVAHRVLVWIEPILYRVISLTGTEHSKLLLTFRTKPTDFLRTRVRHVFADIPGAASTFTVNQVLRRTTELQSLAVLSRTAPSVLDHLKPLRLQRLAIVLEPLFTEAGGTVDLTLPMFASLTHLDLFDPLLNLTDGGWTSKLSVLPALTHLALSRDCITSELDRVTTIFASCGERIRVFVLMDASGVQLGQRGEEVMFVDDERCVIMSLSSQEYRRDWEVGVWGGADFWVRAERFVAKKRRGEIEPKSRHWIIPEDGI
ncbi:hypothetical protein FB45DRAFT_948540 [Roridomyces roridus]|uniref:Uncharacterized protein n=1 Tax=Roridomyces roridus TaxID=1738132 RepID=A0AAD7B0V9_9AGAR|nr:hypothetical protein FB45DRAFT_948540 [Roridomyces roridus]